VLTASIMVRRRKADVLTELPPKRRQQARARPLSAPLTAPSSLRGVGGVAGRPGERSWLPGHLLQPQAPGRLMHCRPHRD
jgi:hypothetical protein